MPIDVKGVAILDDTLSNRLDQLTAVIGMSVQKLNVRVDLDSSATDLPFEVKLVAMTYEPKLRRASKGSMARAFEFSAKRQGKTAVYTASVPLNDLAPFMKASDDLLEVATVVRIGGTSDKKFRAPLTNTGWAVRGVAVQPDGTKFDKSGNAAKEQPDARTLFMAGGVEVLEVKVATSPNLKVGRNDKAWAFVRSPADVFFYSGHGAFWDCQLYTERGDKSLREWLAPEELLPAWKQKPTVANSPFDLDVLIINGCSVLSREVGGLHGSFEAPSCGVRWRELFSTKQGPLVAVLGYRDTAPWDDPWGDRIAEEMGKAIAGGLGKSWEKYAQKWMQINAKYRPTWGAAAIDQKGYWIINMKKIYSDGSWREVSDYDPKKQEGAILGPLPLA